MQICKQIEGWPCLQYDSSKPEELNQFLLANGGKEARFDPTGTAHTLTMVKDEERFVYITPGSWVRCLGKSQFSACTDKRFRSLYFIEPQTQQADAH